MQISTKMDKIRGDYEKRLAEWEKQITHLDSYPPITAVMEMPSQGCYSLFHMGNETLGEVEELWSMLVNGLYDDSNVAFVKQGGDYVLTWSQDDPKAIFEDEMLELVKVVAEEYEYGKTHSDSINSWKFSQEGAKDPTHPFNIWRAMGKKSKGIKRKHGWDDSDSIKAMQKRMDERMSTLKAKLKKGKIV